MARKKSSGGDVGLGGVFRGLGEFIEILSDLAEKGTELKRSGELGNEKRGVKAVYGFSVRVGGAGKPVVERFGNVKGEGEGTVVEEAREPLVDVFDEAEHVIAVAELPGVDENEIRLEVKNDTLTLSAVHGERKYFKEVELPSSVDAKTMRTSFRNGVLEVRIAKAK